MKFSINDSIIKKIASIVILSTTGFIILVVLNVFVINTVLQINQLSVDGSIVRNTYYDSAINIDTYIIGKDIKEYDSFYKNITEVIRVCQLFGDIFRLLNEKTKAELIAQMKTQSDWVDRTEGLIDLVDLMHSDESMIQLIKSTDNFKELAVELRTLGEKYKNNVSPAEEKIIINALAMTNKQHKILGNNFNEKLLGLGDKIVSILFKIYFICAFIILIPVLVYSVIVIRSIISPLKATVAFAQSMADGNFTNSLEIDNKDEFGTLAGTFNGTVLNIREMLSDVSESAKTLSMSSSNLSEISTQLSNGSQNTSDKSETVTDSAREMSLNINSVAAAMEQTSMNVNMVASATEEMTSTISEIAENSENARVITGEAVEQVKKTTVNVNKLGSAAMEIGNVIETITDISEQTNLLALNATIEAARAGSSGKGFAVVATEIKNLASQTSEATLNIKEKITGIQNSTDITVKEIGQITSVISNINDIVSTIASSVEEQSVTTKEIASNISQASQGIEEVTENVNTSSTFASGISSDIDDVNNASSEIASTTLNVSENSAELFKLSQQLNVLVGKFKI